MNASVCYAMKANSNLEVVRLFGELGAGADIVAVGEMRRALAAGIPAKRIIYSGVGKKASELVAALEAGVGQINVESSAELETLNVVAGQLGMKTDITIRVNPDVDAKTHAKITTGRKENKFGVDLDLAREAFALAGRLPHLRVVGIAMHIGSHHTRLDPHRAAAALRCDIVGPSCESGDYLALNRDLPPLSAGDLVMIRSAGAYGAVMASSYNSRPLVPEVMVDGTRFAVTRPRPSIDEMISAERLPPWMYKA